MLMMSEAASNLAKVSGRVRIPIGTPFHIHGRRQRGNLLRTALICLVACLASFVGFSATSAHAVTDRPPAYVGMVHDEPTTHPELVSITSNYLTQCYQFRLAAISGYEGGESICYNHVNNGGRNLQQVLLYCYEPIFGGQTWVLGPIVGQGVYSKARCPYGTGYTKAGTVDYRLQ